MYRDEDLPRREAQAFLPHKSAGATNECLTFKTPRFSKLKVDSNFLPLLRKSFSAMERVVKSGLQGYANKLARFRSSSVRISSSGDDRFWPKGDLAVPPSSSFLLCFADSLLLWRYTHFFYVWDCMLRKPMRLRKQSVYHHPPFFEQ